jgi:hypothetical protein
MTIPAAATELSTERLVKKALGICLYAVFLFFLLEGSTRGFLSWKHGLPLLFSPEAFITKTYYAEVNEVRERSPQKGDENFDVLFLGASALHPAWSSIAEKLELALEKKGGVNVKIHNIAQPGHTTLDSLYKYRLLKDQDFDLVLIYHGINDVRTNNAPPEVFRADYGHYSWYDEVNRFLGPAASKTFVLPGVVKGLIFYVQKKLGIRETIPHHDPSPEWVEHGALLKSPDSFESHLQGIIELAREKEETVLLMNFTYYVPENYSLDQFKKNELDYGNHHSAIEVWGNPANVTEGIAAHNRVIERLAADPDDHVLFVKQHGTIPRSGAYFNDICHLTHLGCEWFVKNIVRATQVPPARS